MPGGRQSCASNSLLPRLSRQAQLGGEGFVTDPEIVNHEDKVRVTREHSVPHQVGMFNGTVLLFLFYETLGKKAASSHSHIM